MGMVQMNKIKVKLDTWHTTSEGIARYFLRMSPGRNTQIGNIEIVTGDEFDYVVVFDHVRPVNKYPPEKVLLFQWEPRFLCASSNFPKTQAKYDYTLNVTTVPLVWYFSMSYEELIPSPVKTRLISGVVSEKIHALPLYGPRLNFVKDFLSQIPEYHHYGRGEAFFKGFLKPENYRGMVEEKSDALLPYKYTFNSENIIEKNYVTEKFFDPLLCETLCFYSGTTDVDKFFDPNCYVRIDLSQPQKSLDIIRECIANNEYDHKIEAIRREKKRILEEVNFLQYLNREVSKIHENSHRL